MKVDQLRELALKFGIKDPENMRKPELKTELIARLIAEAPDEERKDAQSAGTEKSGEEKTPEESLQKKESLTKPQGELPEKEKSTKTDTAEEIPDSADSGEYRKNTAAETMEKNHTELEKENIPVSVSTDRVTSTALLIRTVIPKKTAIIPIETTVITKRTVIILIETAVIPKKTAIIPRK